MIQFSQAANQLFSKLDTNGNGISARELRQLDQDKNGKLTATEAPGLSKTELAQANKALKIAKKNGEDTVVFDRNAGAKAGNAPSEVGFPDKVASYSVPDKTMGVANGSGYYPHNNAMEGGVLDKQDKPLCTLQDCLEGKASYVSIALDEKLYAKGALKYGDSFRIPEIEKKYGKAIVFKAVDTGDAFKGRDFGKVDICVRTKKDTFEPTINGDLTLIKASGL